MRAADELDPYSYKAFYSGEGTSDPARIPTLFITYNRPPNATTGLGPADGSVITTPTPILSANRTTDPDPGDTVRYWFRATTQADAETGAKVVDSGWLTSTPPGTSCPDDKICFPVPDGAFADGQRYWWHVITWDGVIDGPSGSYGYPNWSWSLHVNMHLGAEPAAPVDQFGPARVNLASGNLMVGHDSPAYPVLGGPMGLSFAYNSQAPAGTTGLVGSYYNDDGSHSFAGKTPVMVRTDPTVNFNWGNGSPGPGVGADSFLVRWTGSLRVPNSGDYTFYTANDDGVRATVGTTVVADRWQDGSNTAPCPTSCFTMKGLVGGAALPITVEYYEHLGSAFLTLGVVGPVGPNQEVKASALLPEWLSPEVNPPMPRGWSFSPAATASYTGAAISESTAVLIDVSGATHAYTWTGSGYAPPPGEDGLLAKRGGDLILHDEDGMTYVFDSTGRLRSATSGTDDRDPSAPVYGWSGTPLRLRTVTDPVSGQTITLSYGGDAACAPPPSGQGFDAGAPAGMLCRAQYSWDNTDTKVFYSNGRLARIDDPGSSAVDLADTDFRYDGAGLLTHVRDPLVVDAIAAGVAANDDTTRTVISYSGTRATSVTLAAPAAQAPRPGRSYEYPSPNETRVRAAGLTEPHGFFRKVTLDDAGRMVTDTDATNKTTSFVWDEADRQLARTDPANRRTTTVYDVEGGGAPTDSYGPAPASCFGGDHRPNGSCSGVPHTTTVYDGGIAGLAARYWSNADFAGPPTLHRTGVGDATGALVADWSSSPPDGSLGSAWSARFSGEINLPQPSNLNLSGSGTMTLWVNDDDVGQTDVVDAGRHRIQVDFQAGASPSISLGWRTPGEGSFTPVPGGWLNPRYGLATRTTVDDATAGSPPSVSVTAYDRPETGLASSVTQDPGPGGLNLLTATAYEDPGAGKFFRRLSRTLPANNATTYAHYAKNESRTNPCPNGVAANQGGRPRTTAAPDPDGPGPQTPRTSEVVYDGAGRPVATRIGGEAWTCVTYDVRGRALSRSIPAFGGQPARTVTYNWAVGGNPLKTSVADATGTITTTVDLLGRTTVYTDAAGNTTNSSYDQAGRLVQTTGPGLAQSTQTDYDAAGRPTAQKVDGATMATPAYDGAGELTSVTYGNGTKLSAIGRDPAGRTTALTWLTAGNQNMATDSVTRSQSGRVVTQTIDGGAADSFGYDTAGRLTSATVGGRSLSYGFGDASAVPCRTPGATPTARR